MNTVVPMPKIEITVNTVSLDGFLNRLEQVRVQQVLSAPALCELKFLDDRTRPEQTCPFQPGDAVTVCVDGQSAVLFDGQVTAIEYEYRPGRARGICVRAYDRLHSLRKRQPVRVHAHLTPLDLAREMVAPLGMTADAASPGPVFERLFQWRQSDLDLLIEVAQRCGFWLSLKENVLHLITLQGHGDPVDLVLGDSLLEAQIEVNADSVCSSVMAAGWGASRIESFRGLALEPRVASDVDVHIDPALFGTNGERTLVNEAAADGTHADAIAQAELDHRLQHRRLR